MEENSKFFPFQVGLNENQYKYFADLFKLDEKTIKKINPFIHRSTAMEAIMNDQIIKFRKQNPPLPYSDIIAELADFHDMKIQATKVKFIKIRAKNRKQWERLGLYDEKAL